MFKTLLSRPKLFYLGLMSFGTSVCFALQLSNLSSIFKFLGVSSSNLPWLWLAPPLTGLIIQPLIGQISDDTATRWGKRIPYVIGWGGLTIAAFIFLPLVSSITFALFITIVMDCSLNGSTEALRALTSDLTKSQERSQALTLQGVFSGIGAAVGTSLPFITDKVISDAPVRLGEMPCTLRYSFYTAALILFLILFYSIKRVKEKPIKQRYLIRKYNPMTLGQRIYKILTDITDNISNVPDNFRKVCYIHSLSWIGIFIFWLYFSTTICQNVYGVPYFIKGSPEMYASVWAKASVDTSKYFSIYQYVSIVYAFILYFLPKETNLHVIHGVSICLGGAGIMLLGLENNTTYIIFSLTLVGIMWGSMITLPYVIAMQLLPKGKAGIYLGIFNICITVPQLFCGMVLSPLYRYIFQNHAGYLLAFAGMLIALSGFLWVKEVKKRRNFTFSQDYAELQPDNI